MNISRKGDSGSPDASNTAAEASNRRFYGRVLVLLVSGALTYVAWQVIRPMWQPLLWAILIGALLAPWHARLVQRLGGRAQLASYITVIATVLVLVVPLMLLLAGVGAQAAFLLQKLNAFIPSSGGAEQLDVTRLQWISDAIAWLEAHFGVSPAQLQEWLVAGLKRLLESLMSFGGRVLMGAAGSLASAAVALFVLFFVLRDGPVFARQALSLLPMSPANRARLLQYIGEVTRAVFVGVGLTAVIQGCLVGIGFAIARLPSPLVFGAVAMVAALIPMVGTAFIWVPGVAFLAASGDYGHAAFLAIWGAGLVSTVDNFLRPMLISGRVEVPTITVFIGVVGGLSAFGFIGLLLGPIVLAVGIALFHFFSGSGAERPSP